MFGDDKYSLARKEVLTNMCSRPMQVRQGRSSIHPASRPGSTQDLSGLGEPEGRCGERGDVGRMPPGKHPEQVAPGLHTTPGSDLPTCPAQGPLVWASEEPIEPYFSPCTAPGALFPDSRRGASPGIPPQDSRAWSPQIRPAWAQMRPSQQLMGRWGPGAGKCVGLPESSAPTVAWGPQPEKSPCPR